MDIDIQNEYNVNSQHEIINRCNFRDDHIMQTKLLPDSLISQQGEQDGIIDNKR